MMKTLTTLKLTGAAIIAMGLTSGLAMAGEGHKKDCGKKTTAQMSTTSTTAGYAAAATSVASTATEANKMASKKMHHSKMKVMSFDDALELCTSKNVSNLQACVDKKTGKTKPAS